MEGHFVLDAVQVVLILGMMLVVFHYRRKWTAPGLHERVSTLEKEDIRKGHRLESIEANQHSIDTEYNTGVQKMMDELHRVTTGLSAMTRNVEYLRTTLPRIAAIEQLLKEMQTWGCDVPGCPKRKQKSGAIDDDVKHDAEE